MSEGKRERPPTEEVLPGLWSIALPMPGPLGYVLVYALLLEDGRVLLIDAGWDSRAQWDALERGLAQAEGLDTAGERDTQAPVEFLGTIKGKNHHWRLFEEHKDDPRWYTLFSPA